MKFYSTRPVHSLTSKVFTEVSSCSKVINAFVDRPVEDWKARLLFHQSFPTFLHKIKYNDVARRDSYPQFPWSTLGMPVTMIPFWQTRKNKKEKKRLHFLSLAAKASMNKDLGWDTLEMRGRQFRLTLMYKLTHGLIDIGNREYLIQHSDTRTRGSHQFRFRVP